MVDFPVGEPSSSAVASVCLASLGESQNPDGGWGFGPAKRSSVEPTCWALLALSNATVSQGAGRPARALDWLCQTQLPDGSWPAYRGQPVGCWVSSLACLALSAARGPSQAFGRGLQWLCESWPAEGGWWWQLRIRLSRAGTLVQQDSSLRGWSWTPHTSSWVEPTAFALLALRSAPSALHPPSAARRRQLGERMLYDRMCPGGGWNCGNPMVYGVPGEPAVGPTVWALLALQQHTEREENRQSLDWLARVFPHIQGSGSLALAHLCLRLHNRRPPPLEPTLRPLLQANESFKKTEVAAWSALALSPTEQFFFSRSKQ